MKVKIGDVIYDAEKEPIMIILNEQDKQNIKNMHYTANKYCCFPKSKTKEEIERFMDYDNVLFLEGDKTDE